MTTRHMHPDVHPPYGVAPKGYRLPDATHVGAVHLQIADLDRSVDYYSQAIGLRVLDRTSGAATLGPDGPDLALVHLRERKGARPVPRHGTFGLYHFAILLPDRAALGRFAGHLARNGMRVGMADHLVSEALYLWDPDGLGIEVYADRPRNTWQHRGTELVMTTDPLDVENLLAASGGQSWNGAPAGTTMGHVHLHVGALDAADAFYHSGLGFDKTVWRYPGALFFSAGGYHHHLGTNVWAPGPAARDDQARLIEWELMLPTRDDAAAAARSLADNGYAVDAVERGWGTADPWNTRLVLRSPE